MCGMLNRPKINCKNVKNFRSNDIDTYLATLKIGTKNVVIAGHTLERTGMHAIFSGKGQKAKNGKIFENLGKNIQNLKIFC